MGVFDHIPDAPKQDIFAHIPDTVPPRMQPETEDQTAMRQAQGKAFGLGAARGATYGAADLLPKSIYDFKKNADEAEAANPNYFSGGEMVGGIGSAMLNPLAPETLAMKAITPAANALKAIPYAGGLAAGAVKGATAAGAGQFARGAVNVTQGADPEAEASKIGSAELLGGEIGGPLGVASDVAGNYLGNKKISAFNKGIPEVFTPEQQLAKEVYDYRQRQGTLPLGAKDPSLTNNILDEGITGSRAKMASEAQDRDGQVHDQLRGILGSVENNPKYQMTSGQMYQDFMNKNSNRLQKQMAGKSPEAMKTYAQTVQRLFQAPNIDNLNAPTPDSASFEELSGTQGKNPNSAAYSDVLAGPQTMNEMKQAAYRNLNNPKAWEGDQLGMGQAAHRDASLYLKNLVESKVDSAAADSSVKNIDPGQAGIVKQLNQRSAALNNLQERLAYTPDPDFGRSVWKGAKVGGTLGAIGAIPFAAGGNPMHIYGTAAAIGGVAGLGDYMSQQPGVASRAASLYNLLQGANEKYAPSVLAGAASTAEKGK